MTTEKQPFIYLNTAGSGILSRESVSAAEKFQESTTTNPTKNFFQ